MIRTSLLDQVTQAANQMEQLHMEQLVARQLHSRGGLQDRQRALHPVAESASKHTRAKCAKCCRTRSASTLLQGATCTLFLIHVPSFLSVSESVTIWKVRIPVAACVCFPIDLLKSHQHNSVTMVRPVLQAKTEFLFALRS